MIVFFHGLESTPVSNKSTYLETMYDAWCPVMDYTQPGIFEKVLKEVREKKPTLLIGSSMGGWFAYCISTLTGIPTLLFNPALQGRTIDPQVKRGSKKAKHIMILGKSDDVIDPYETLSWVKSNGVGTFEHHFENYGHRTPISTFKKYVNLIKNKDVKSTALKEIYKIEMKHVKLFETFTKSKSCPIPTKDLEVNTKNRDRAIHAEHIEYGPLNVDEPDGYWEHLADHWNTSVEAAKKSTCGNCVAFDISPRMLECMPGEISDEDGKLGYCWMHHFKCHSARSCYTWAKGGPITEDNVSYGWQEKNVDAAMNPDPIK